MTAHNNVTIIGRLTRDPETKYTAQELCICNISIAVDGRKKDDESSFIDVTLFGKTAEVVGQHFSKGKPIAVQGSLKQERWEDKESGAKRSKIVVLADTFSFLPSVAAVQEGAPAQRLDGVKRSDGRRPATAPLPAGNDEDQPPF